MGSKRTRMNQKRSRKLKRKQHLPTNEENAPSSQQEQSRPPLPVVNLEQQTDDTVGIESANPETDFSFLCNTPV